VERRRLGAERLIGLGVRAERAATVAETSSAAAAATLDVGPSANQLALLISVSICAKSLAAERGALLAPR
jgi:hypothetical protein